MHKKDFTNFAFWVFMVVTACLVWLNSANAQVVNTHAFQVVTDEGKAFCSGGVVEGFGVTAGHCMGSYDIGDIVLIQGESRNMYQTVLVARCDEDEPLCDYALLAGDFSEFTPLTLAKDFTVGQEIYYIGSPNGLGLFRFDGRYIGNPWNEKSSQLMIFDVRGTGGSSGSIVVNSDNGAVAIITYGRQGRVDFRGMFQNPLDVMTGFSLRDVFK